MSEEFRKLKDIISIENYNTATKVYYREACRAIIFENGKIIVLRSKKYGDYSLPGGGVNEGESYIEALKREVLEEAGIIVKNIKPYATIEEFRKPLEKDLELFHMKSFLFLCELESENNPTNLEDYEIELGYEIYKVSVEEAIENNKKLLSDKRIFWLERETKILEDIKENYIDIKNTTS